MSNTTRDVTIREAIIIADTKFDVSPVLAALKQVAAEAEKIRIRPEDVGVAKDSMHEAVIQEAHQRQLCDQAQSSIAEWSRGKRARETQRRQAIPWGKDWTGEANVGTPADLSAQAGPTSTFAAEPTVRQASRAAGMAGNLSIALPDVDRSALAAHRGSIDQTIRVEENESMRDCGFRQKTREVLGVTAEQRAASTNPVADLDPMIHESQPWSNRSDRDKRASRQAHEAALHSFETQRRTLHRDTPTARSTGSTSSDGFGEQAEGCADWTAVGETDRTRQEHNQKIGPNAGSERSEFTAQQQIAQDRTAIESRHVSLFRQHEGAERGLNVVREQARQSRLMAESDEGQVSAASRPLEALDPGDALKLRRLDQKANRIEQQEHARANGNNIPAEPLNTREIPEMTQFDGSKSDTASRGTEQLGPMVGLRFPQQQQAVNSKNLSEEIETATNRDEPALIKVINEAAAANQQVVERLKETLKKALSFEQIAAELDRWAAENRAAFERWKKRRFDWI